MKNLKIIMFKKRKANLEKISEIKRERLISDPKD